MSLYFIERRNFPYDSMMRKIDYQETQAFARDMKRLEKKFPSLSKDFETLKKNAVEVLHIKGLDAGGIPEIKGVGNSDDLMFYKVKKFACRSMKGRGSKSGIRVIYAFFPKEWKIVFLEIYFKGEKENEDRERIYVFRDEYGNTV
jgi:mRNA-degrading endonuclease RelE of RelBE toxin-antitoxin system